MSLSNVGGSGGDGWFPKGPGGEASPKVSDNTHIRWNGTIFLTDQLTRPPAFRDWGRNGGMKRRKKHKL